MSKILVLAEKPSVGKEIGRVLGCRKNCGGYLEGPEYLVTWALGHLVELVDPEYYGEQYKTWSMDTLPMLPEKMALQVIPQTAKQYHVVKNLLHSKEVSSLIIATDAGREGELVARWIIEKAGFHKPLKRLWISSQTDKAIKDGFTKLKDGRAYDALYQSAQSRAEADWLVGLNVTRALTCKYNAQLSAGRVQTPTLALIVKREEEIKKFVPRDYHLIQADLGHFFVTWHDAKNQTAIFDAKKAEEIAEKIKNKQFTVQEIKITPKRTPPPMLYDLTELQRDANRLYQMSPKETLSVMQRLYEQEKALTYPRTDSRYLTDDIVPTLADRLKAVSKGDFAPIVSAIRKENKKIAKSCINNNKVSDHHAIIPTEQSINMAKLTTPEKRIYLLVVKRFLTCFYPDYEYRHIRAEFSCEKESFFAAGREVLQKGWKQVSDIQEDAEEAEQLLPSIQKGSVYTCKTIQLKKCKTTPPPRYTEATLLSAMENPAKFVAQKEMKDYLGSGLGTPATRADIIEKLFSSFYVEKKGTSLIPTPKGVQLVSLVPEDLKEPLLTAKWEEKLEAISKGKEQKNNFISDIRSYTKKLVQTVAESQETYTHHNITRQVCPVCGKFLLKVKGKKGEMLICEDRNCGHRQNLSMETNMRCPKCHKKMELFGDGEGRTYICRCGFREKAESLHQKLNSQPKASKQTVQQYLKNQSKQEEKELSPLAKALLEAFPEAKKEKTKNSNKK